MRTFFHRICISWENAIRVEYHGPKSDTIGDISTRGIPFKGLLGFVSPSIIKPRLLVCWKMQLAKCLLLKIKTAWDAHFLVEFAAQLLFYPKLPKFKIGTNSTLYYKASEKVSSLLKRHMRSHWHDILEMGQRNRLATVLLAVVSFSHNSPKV